MVKTGASVLLLVQLLLATPLGVVVVNADVVTEFAALHSLVSEAGCLPYFETYFGWSSSLLQPGTLVRACVRCVRARARARARARVCVCV